MKKLMHDIVCSNIRIDELKLKRIRLCKKRLLETKPSRLDGEKLREWQTKFEELEKEEETVLKETQDDCCDLEDYL